MMLFIVHWIVSAVAILIAAYILPGVGVSGFGSALIAALVIGLINAVLRPILLFLTLPVNILTLGLFTFIVNGLLILLASYIVPGFHVDTIWWAILFGIIMAVVSYLLEVLIVMPIVAP